MSAAGISVIVIIGVIVGVMLIAAGVIWVERRLLGSFQERYGPNRAGPFGVLQVVADMVKIFTKENWIPPFADKAVFIIAPAIIMVTTLASFAVIPIAPVHTRVRPGYRPALLPGHVLIRGVQRCPGGVVLQQQVQPPGRHPRGGPDGELRSVHGHLPPGSGGDGRLAQPQGHRGGAARPVVRGSAICGLRGLLHCPAWQRREGCPSTCRRRKASWLPATTPSTRASSSQCSMSGNTSGSR